MTKAYIQAIRYYVVILATFIFSMGFVSLGLSFLLWTAIRLANQPFINFFLYIFVILFAIAIFHGLFFIPMLPLIKYPKIFKCLSCKKYDAVETSSIHRDSSIIKCSNCGAEHNPKIAA